MGEFIDEFPLVQLVKLIGPEEEMDFGLSIFFSDFEQGFVGEAYFLLRYLVGEYLKFGVFPGNAFKHGQPVVRCEKRWGRAKGGVIGGAKKERFETGLSDCLFGQGQMSVVHRVEGATEKTDLWPMG